jgi:hypothetical protein
MPAGAHSSGESPPTLSDNLKPGLPLEILRVRQNGVTVPFNRPCDSQGKKPVPPKSHQFDEGGEGTAIDSGEESSPAFIL